VEFIRIDGHNAARECMLNTYVWDIMDHFSALKRIKEYSAPYAMKAFCRIYIFLLPIF
jgi:hypothetical protein